MKTRHTAPLRLTRPAPRNPVASAARARHAGSHRTSGGAQRQQARRELRQWLQHAAQDPRTPHRPSP